MPQTAHDDPVLTLIEQGRAGEAERTAARRCEQRPEDAQAWFLLGVARHLVGRFAEALAAFEHTVRLVPGHVQAHSARGNMLSVLGRFAEALEAYERALALAPEDPELLANRAIVLERLQRPAEALESYDEALARAPDKAGALMNRGVLLMGLGRLEEALANNERLAAAHPSLAEAHLNLAEVLLALRRFEPALEAARRALALEPRHLQARVDEGTALAALGRVQEASAAFEAARAADARGFEALEQRTGARADPLSIHLHAGWERQQRCDWSDREHYLATFQEAVREGVRRGEPLADPALMFPATALPLAPDVQPALAAAVSRQVAARTDPAGLPSPGAPAPRLRVGYISPYFRNHPSAVLTRELYALHDRGECEVYGYSLHPGEAGSLRTEIKRGFDRFRGLSSLSDADAAARIRADGIHVLVDLAGYSRDSRMGILARRPAPVQVSYLGFQATLGAEFVPYRISDAVMTPPGSEAHWREALVRLPHCCFVYGRPALAEGPPPERAALGLPARGTVFCAFHNGYKIEPRSFGIWMSLLRELPASVLWLLAGEPEMEQNLRREAAARGVSGERLVFAPRLPLSEHLGRLPAADLFLDAFVYGAHTTGCEALWTGLPLLTCPGERVPSRIAASLLQAVGLPELVAPSPEAYLQSALRLARDPDELSRLRERLARSRTSAPLFRTEDTVRALERGYRMMWERHVRGEPPTTFDVPAP